MFAALRAVVQDKSVKVFKIAGDSNYSDFLTKLDPKAVTSKLSDIQSCQLMVWYWGRCFYISSYMDWMVKFDNFIVNLLKIIVSDYELQV